MPTIKTENPGSNAGELNAILETNNLPNIIILNDTTSKQAQSIIKTNKVPEKTRHITSKRKYIRPK